MKRLVSLALMLVLAVPILSAVAQLPVPGAHDAPIRTHVAQRYLERGVEETGSQNIITAVLLDYRLFDTFGEAAVIFTALVGVLAVLSAGGRVSRSAARREDDGAPGEVTRFIVTRTVPAIVVFGVYTIVAGHDSPGGAFQGGVVLGAALIAFSLGAGTRRARALVSDGALPWMQGAAMLTFLVFALAGLVIGEGMLRYPLVDTVPAAREWLMLVIEAGIGVAGAAIIVTMFWSMEARR